MDVTCTACVVVDDTGRELFARAASQLLPNASTTKMTTALVVRRAAEPTESVVISARAAATGGGGLDLRPGEIYSVEALLFALLLDSSNDAAVALAEHVSGSHEAFVAEMNEIAGELGATDTSYVTAHGLDMPGHGSSARDLAAIADQLLADPLLARIVASPHARIEGRGGVLTVENRNLLLEGYPGATGVKTGFTAGAGNVLVASAERDGRRIIAVAMHSVDAATDAAALLDFGWQQLAETVVLPRGKEVGAIVFDHGSTPVIAARPVRDSVAPSDITYSFRPEGRLPLPVSPGDVLGRVIVTSAGGMVDSVDAVAAGAVAQEEDPWASGFFAGLLRAVGDLVTTP
jgi:D-alanyl-D-alanine carboxypeptidase (penicillin-binding protein 5/6)